MARNLAPTTNQASRSPSSLSWHFLLYAGLAILLGGFLRGYLHHFRSEEIVTGQILVLVVGLLPFHLILVYVFERLLAFTILPDSWRYRAAFFGSLSMAVTWLTMVEAGSAPNGFLQAGGIPSSELDLVILGSALAGAFLGGVIASGIQAGFWENNSPPADWIQNEVLDRHRAEIGIPASEPWSKRIFDLALALFGLLVSSPIWILSSLLIWFEDPGPVLFVKNSVGKGGRNFHQYKFRTMVMGAEDHTGPVLSELGDQRILRFGRVLRKTALDELPQLINILRGEMSFVGPRPQRTVLVLDYLKNMPEYAERHRVLPGLAGLAQVAGDYYLTPRQKLRFDRLYIRYSSLGFDLKLLLLAFLITFWYRWHKDWAGRLPRQLLRFGSRSKTWTRR
jgi:lipopolysaccharide/colanic/teichoic acid biosynthesis glycosyltransferase